MFRDDSSKLKSLQTRLQQKHEELKRAEHEAKENSLKIKDINSTISSLKQEIKSFTERDLVISEHALLRYFERVLGYNLDSVKEQILKDCPLPTIKTLGGKGKFPSNSERFYLVLKDHVVVTIEN